MTTGASTGGTDSSETTGAGPVSKGAEGAGTGVAGGRPGKATNGAGAPRRAAGVGDGMAPAGGNGGSPGTGALPAGSGGRPGIGELPAGTGGSGAVAGTGGTRACIVSGCNGAGGGKLAEFDAAPAASIFPLVLLDPGAAGAAWQRIEPFQLNNEHPSRATTNVRRGEIKFRSPRQRGKQRDTMNPDALGQADKLKNRFILPAKSSQ